MNPLRLLVCALVFGFLLLWALSPRRPRLALAYLRLVLLGSACLLVLAPFFWLLAAVFKDRDYFNEYLFFPPLSEWSSASLNLDNFRRLLAGKPSVTGTVYFWQYVLNSLFFACTSTVLQLLFCSLGGYALARYDFRGKTALMTFMLGSMMIPGVLLMAPIYELMVKLQLIDTYHGLIIPGVVGAYGIFLFRQAILGVPAEIVDAGRIDGCSELKIYYSLVMPLVRPMAAAFCLVSFLGNWNAFFGPNVFLHSQAKLTLPVVLNLYVSQYGSDYGVFLSGTALAILPPAVLFFALEKEFVGGLTSGAVKG
ncbi:MAG TPA: carbohydrate ABC transporter permease [Polyangiaceae bacterium]|nr:carbohydrate ABC transporter permease [Polyangiaceae bacterium]